MSVVTNRAGAGRPGQTPACYFQLQTGQAKGKPGQGQGRVAKADTRPLFSVIDRVGQGQGRAARANIRPLFLVTNKAGHII